MVSCPRCHLLSHYSIILIIYVKIHLRYCLLYAGKCILVSVHNYSISCNEPVKRKRLGLSGTFMAQWFRRWTLERATRGSIPARSVTYPKKYAHGFCFAVLCCGYTLTDFLISIRLTSLALWQSNDCPSASKATLMNMDKYFMWINYERLHYHNKAKHNKTVCIFLGIYCRCGILQWYHMIHLCWCWCMHYCFLYFKWQ